MAPNATVAFSTMKPVQPIALQSKACKQIGRDWYREQWLKNKNNLIIGSNTQMQLRGVCSLIQQPPCASNALNCTACSKAVQMDTVTPNTPVFEVLFIDPLGELFGNTVCGTLNFTRFQEPSWSSMKHR